MRGKGMNKESKHGVAMNKPLAGKKISLLPLFLLISLVMGFTVTPALSEPPNGKLQNRPNAERRYAPDTIIVKFKSHVTPDDVAQGRLPNINRLNTKQGVHTVKQMFPKRGKDAKLDALKDTVGLTRIHKLKVPPGMDIMQAVADYAADPDVEYAEPDYSVYANQIPNDSYYASTQWSLNNTGVFYTGDGPVYGTAHADIDAQKAWDITTGVSSVVIAIIDSGVQADHPDLAGKVLAGWDFVNNDNNPDDDNGHGTHVAGIAAANSNNNATGTAGVCWGCSILPVKVADANKQATASNIASGIEWAVDWSTNVKVINLSLGEYGILGYFEPLFVHDAIVYAYAAGRVIVAASGNDNTEDTPYPASFSEVIAVGATDNNDKRATPVLWGIYGSNFGSYLDVVAPGDRIVSLDKGSAYKFDSGTSMAAPHVAGLAGLILSVNPNLTPSQVRSYIENGVQDQLGDPLEDTPGWDKYYGWGRINAYNSVLSVALDTFPTATSFSVTPNSVTQGNSFTITYCITDDIGLKQAELLRATDTNGDGQPDWSDSSLIKTTTLSSQTSYCGSFTDTPQASGTYWYGLHAVDSSDNWNDEQNSKTGGSPGDYGPIQGTVTSGSTCTDSYESNDSSSQAYGPLSSGSSSSGKICTSTDVDWFKINVTSPGTISLSLSVPSANDYDLELYSPTYSWAAGSNTRGNGSSESISYNATSTGTYYLRVYGYPSGNGSYNDTNSYTLSYNFTTGNAPIVTTSSASSVASIGATLNGSIDPNGSSTTTWFEWGTSSTLSTYNSTPSSSSFSSLSTSQATLSGLSPSTTYYYRTAASNNGGTSRGTILNFTTSASQTTQTELITNGSFSSGISGWTQQGVDSWAGTNLTNYRTSPGYAALGVDSTGTPKNSADGAFYQTVSIPANATAANLSFWYYITTNETGLTAYDYLYVTVRDSSGNLLTSVATLSNVDKTTGYVQKTFDLSSDYIGQTIRIRFGATTDSLSTTTFRIDDVSIAVSYSVPSVTTSSASATSTSATLNGSVNPNGSSTNTWFEWGTSSTLSSYTQTSNQSIGSGTTSQAVSASLSGLNPSTTYYYRVAASNSAGTQQGSILSFSTQAAQITTRTLSVSSSNPSSGVSITVSPNDNNSYGNGTASFTRTYNDKTSVSLSAPSTASGNNFQKWQRNGSDYSTSSSTSVTMDADYTMTAVYLTPSVSYQLTTSTSPSSGGSISPNCSGGCPYSSGTSVSLTATANSGYTFSYWSGCDSTSGSTCYVTMNSNKSVTAYFTTTSDTTPPTISSTSPSSNATGVFVSAPITATFSEGMDSSTITASTFTLRDSGNNLVNGNITYSSTTATFTPSSSLSYNTTYTATITTGVKDAAGNAMTSNYSWNFTTGAETVPSQPTLSSPVTVATDGRQLPRIKKWGNNVYVLNGDSNRNLMFYRSTDNGATFTSTTLAYPVFNGYEYEFSMDTNGYLYAFWENSNDEQLYIRKSTDGGSTWSLAATVASGFTWMDNPSGYFSNGTLYLLFRGYKNSNTELYLTKSTDNGSTFSAPVQVTSNSIQEEDGKIAVFGNNVYVVYYDYNSSDGTGNIYLVTSSDSGSSFGSPVQVNRTTGKSYFGPSMDVGGSGNILVAYKDTTSDYEGDLYVAKSTDGGSSFIYILAADSTYGGQGNPILFVEGNGYVHLLWQDNRDNYTAGPAYSTVYYTRSVDEGASYETNVNIDSLGNIGNGSLYVDSDVVYLAVTDYKTSPWSTIFYKLSWVAADTAAPSNTTATNFINNGAVSTGSTSVTLSISATDAVGVTAYYASEISTTPSSSASGWTAITSTTSYSASVSFTLSSGDGTKTVYVWFKDAAGNVSASASDSITLSTGSALSVQTLVVGGGGGGGMSGGGGGGGGGYLYNTTLTITPGSYPVVVGSGGMGGWSAHTDGYNGGDSSFATLVAVGGGGGGAGAKAGISGGSGGGAGYFSYVAGGNGTTEQGNKGGDSVTDDKSGAGGGGAYAAGGNNTAYGAGGNGGNGTENSISGTLVTYAGGGGGGEAVGGYGGPGSGGTGGGGNGNTWGKGGYSGLANSGGGGGGGGGYQLGGDGGSGIVITRYPTGSINASGGTVTYSGGDTIHTFTASGTFTISDTTAPTTTASPAGGTFTSAQSVTLTANKTAIIYYTTDGSEPTMFSTIYSSPISISASTTLKFFATDLAGNSEAVKAELYTINSDTNAPEFNSTSPASDSFINTATVGYSLSEAVASGSVTFTRTGGNADSSAHAYNFTSSDITAGSHSINPGLVLVNGAIYTVTFEATDAAGNTGSVSSTNITYDTSYASVTITSPAANSVTNNAQVTYTLSEDISAGDIVFTRTGGASDSMSPYTYTLSASERTAGSHTVDAGKTLMDGTIYTVSFENIKDMAGNQTASISTTNVTYDSTSVTITGTSPASNSIITTATVSYTLSEQAQSGKITLTRTSGSADSSSPHLYDLTASDLTAGSHTINTNLPLVDGAFYTVSFDATDLVGNAATTISNAMVYYDSGYGTGPMGNVDSSGASASRVDGFDLIKLSLAFGSRSGDANWNPACDLDGNGTVVGNDLVILGSHFGEAQ